MVISMGERFRASEYVKRGGRKVTRSTFGNPLLEGLRMTKKLEGILRRLDKGSEDVRLRALDTLCDDKNEQVVMAGVYQALKNDNFWVRHRAVKKWRECLRKGMDLKETFPVIVRCISDSTELVREEAKEAVLHGMMIGHRDSLVDALKDAMKDEHIGRYIEGFIKEHC